MLKCRGGAKGVRKAEDGFEIISDENRRWREQAIVTARGEDEKSRRKRRAEAKREKRARKRARYKARAVKKETRASVT